MQFIRLKRYETKNSTTKTKDSEPMLVLMYDKNVVEKLQADFTSKTIEDGIAFMANGRNAEIIYLAITEDDNYIGIAGLKHITKDTAEFAITVGTKAICRKFVFHQHLLRRWLSYSF